jgi:addiction module HigA family antidote
LPSAPRRHSLILQKDGWIPREEFLEPLGITQYRLAKEIGVPQARIGEIVARKRSVTADTGLRLSRFFGMSDGFSSGLQLDYDTAMARERLAKTLEKIMPLAAACALIGTIPQRDAIGARGAPYGSSARFPRLSLADFAD